ncbi:MAG TPA: diguanylate cyclase [Vicinamibacterales bacterium]|nr:diguanylate cyclase [Vicinamibacterales bacterium]
MAVIYAWRVRQLERSERRLMRLVEERTAELRERTAQLEIANTALEELATVDPLTGLANRRRFDVFVQQEWQRAARHGLPLSLMLIDIDYFKRFNDRYGHPAGDECLRQVAAVLRAAANRVSDLTCRYGGEEFAVVLGGTDAQGARTVAEFIRHGVELIAIPHEDAPGSVVTVSIGVGTRTGDEYGRPAALIAACDRALYEAKNLGRNRTHVATPVEA